MKDERPRPRAYGAILTVARDTRVEYYVSMTQSAAEVQIITSTELKKHTGEHLDHVLKGGAILVTRNGRALGFLIPAKMTDEGVAVPDIAV